jgi:hypothetical protein
MVDRAEDRWWLPILWVILVAMLLYAPLPTQRRYLLGIQTPLAALAAYGWSRAVLPHFISSRAKRVVTGGYLLFAGIALLAMIVMNGLALATPAEHPALFYNPDELAGQAWLRSHADPNDVVLTTFDASGNGSGGHLVAATGERVFIGHWIETVNFDQKVAQVAQFYNPATSDDWRRNFLHNNHIAYIWYDDYARESGRWNPAGADYLQMAFESGGVTVYRVLDVTT